MPGGLDRAGLAHRAPRAARRARVRVADLVATAEPAVVVEVVGGQAVVAHELTANGDIATEPCARGAAVRLVLRERHHPEGRAAVHRALRPVRRRRHRRRHVPHRRRRARARRPASALGAAAVPHHDPRERRACRGSARSPSTSTPDRDAWSPSDRSSSTAPRPTARSCARASRCRSAPSRRVASGTSRTAPRWTARPARSRSPTSVRSSTTVEVNVMLDGEETLRPAVGRHPGARRHDRRRRHAGARPGTQYAVTVTARDAEGDSGTGRGRGARVVAVVVGEHRRRHHARVDAPRETMGDRVAVGRRRGRRHRGEPRYRGRSRRRSSSSTPATPPVRRASPSAPSTPTASPCSTSSRSARAATTCSSSRATGRSPSVSPSPDPSGAAITAGDSGLRRRRRADGGPPRDRCRDPRDRARDRVAPATTQARGAAARRVPRAAPARPGRLPASRRAVARRAVLVDGVRVVSRSAAEARGARVERGRDLRDRSVATRRPAPALRDLRHPDDASSPTPTVWCGARSSARSPPPISGLRWPSRARPAPAPSPRSARSIPPDNEPASADQRIRGLLTPVGTGRVTRRPR